MGAGTRMVLVSRSTCLDLNIHSPSRRRQVWQEAELGTGVPRRGLERPCQPRRARAKAVRLIVGGGCWWEADGLGLVGCEVVVEGAAALDGGGSIKKLGGRYERMVSMSRPSGRRRLNS